MSAPLVVNTTDGTVWTRRGVLRGGEPLYAIAGVCDCPEYVMATLAELAEHGIAGSAEVLPMPAGSEAERLVKQIAELEEQLAALKAQREVLRGSRRAESARREVADGEHYAFVHHDYRRSRETPETDGAR